MDTALGFRRAGAGDVAEVVALVESAYRGEASRAGWTTEADLLAGRRTDAASVAALVAQPGSVVLVATAPPPGARDGGGIAGCCHLRREGAGAYFGMFAVDPSRQGHGIGRSLLAEASRVAAGEWSSRLMRMTVLRQRDDLIAWYRRLGFEPTGRSEPWPYGDETFGVPLRDDLEFVELARPLGEVIRRRAVSP